MGQFKTKCSLCSVQQVWLSLYWVLRPGWAGGLWWERFYLMLEFPAFEAQPGNQSAQSPASVWVVSPGHTIDCRKVKNSFCSV